MDTSEFHSLSNDALAIETKRSARVERQSTTYLLRLLIEVERRRLHLALGYSSMFVYCTRALLLSEQAAYSRITAARAVRRYPAMLPLLDDGALTLSSVGLLAPHLTGDNVDALLEGARYKSTREVERLIASLHAQPDIPASVRALPMRAAPEPAGGLLAYGVAPTDEGSPDARPQERDPSVSNTQERIAGARPREQPTRTTIAPLSARKYLLRVTIEDQTNGKLRRLQALLRHAIPDGDPAKVIDRALTLLLEQTERRKLAAAARPRCAAPPAPNSRAIRAAVRRTVWDRDGGRCAFAGPDGRCDEAGLLEFHHVVPFAAGGPTTVENLQLRCRAHNAYEAMLYFGLDGEREAQGSIGNV